MSDALNYYGDTLTSSAGVDLFDQIKVATSFDIIVAKEITMVSDTAFTFKTNGKAWVNSVYEDADTKHKVSLTNVRISSVIVVEGSIDIFIGILF